jgi:hypothetical protein
VGQPSARTRRATFATPFILLREATQLGEGNHFAELLVQRGERPEFRCERGEKLPLQAVEDRRQVEHALQTRQLATHSNPAQQILNIFDI